MTDTPSDTDDALSPDLTGESTSVAPSAGRSNDNRAPRGSIPPRVHNVISYGVSAAWMLAVAPWDDKAVFPVVMLWVLHFGRRTLEALFVHRFSGRPVSPADYITEYVYYWGFTNWIAHGLSDPGWEAADGVAWLVGLGLFCLGQFGNASAHLKLRALRERSGEKTLKIPHGGMFELVSGPHYLFEIVTWVGFAVLAQVWGAYGFLALGTVIIITSYALPRHKKYLEEFDGKDGRPLYPENRKAILPFLL